MHAIKPALNLTALCALTLLVSLTISEDSFARRGHYKRQGNVGCHSVSPPSQEQQLRAAGVNLPNWRSPLVTPEVAKYVINLKNKCGQASLQSGFRDCATNLRVGGVSKSRHLGGRAADTKSGCGHSGSQSVCQSSGLQYINEGPNKFPHCQMR